MISDRLPAMSLEIKGLQHTNADGSNRRFEVLICPAGEPVQLRPEPQNKHDPLAIGIFSARDIQLGYVSAERCGRIGQLIRQGREVQAIFQGSTKASAWIRVAFDGDVPTVPARAAVEQESNVRELASEPDFYPDEDWRDI